MNKENLIKITSLKDTFLNIELNLQKILDDISKYKTSVSNNNLKIAKETDRIRNIITKIKNP